MAKDLWAAFGKWYKAQQFSGRSCFEAYKAGRIRAGLVLDGTVQIPEWMPQEEHADHLKDLDDIAAGLLKVAGKPPNEYLLRVDEKASTKELNAEQLGALHLEHVCRIQKAQVELGLCDTKIPHVKSATCKNWRKVKS